MYLYIWDVKLIHQRKQVEKITIKEAQADRSYEKGESPGDQKRRQGH